MGYECTRWRWSVLLLSVTGRRRTVMRKEEGREEEEIEGFRIQGWFPPMMTISDSIQNRPLSFD